VIKVALSKGATLQLIYALDFDDWAKEEGLVGPFGKNGWKGPTEQLPVYSKLYNLLEDIYIIDGIFADEGYEDALERVEFWDNEIVRQYFESLKPCESAERQCDMRCKYFLECEYK
jgi:hypothetical protein